MAALHPKVSPGPAIWDVVRDGIRNDGRLDDSTMPLPDESSDAGGLRWAAGAQDGVLGHHAAQDHARAKAQEIAAAIVEATRKRPTKRRLTRLYATVATVDVITYVDGLPEALVRADPDATAVHEIGRWLAETASHREAVKLGIALMGFTGVRGGITVVRTLGAHEEFTLYSAVALSNGTTDPEDELWALARKVDGWGRIHCVERLRETTRPEIKDWILREGFRNSVMDEYLAHTAATTGELRAALDADADRQLLTAAGRIIEALIAGGPTLDIDDYADAAATVGLYLDHMAAEASTVRDLNAVTAIRAHLQAERDWDDAGNGWTVAARDALIARCDQVLGRPHWPDLVAAEVRSDDPATSWDAERAAQSLGVDTFEVHLERVVEDPLGGPWFVAWQRADAARARRLVELASTRLPLEAIATGPSDAIGLGPEWRPHDALDWTLQALARFPGLGGDLIAVGLRSPTVRNRNTALMALRSWPDDMWPVGLADLVAEISRTDPNPATRETASEVLTAR